MFMSFSLPVYDDNKNIIGVLSADIDGMWLSDQIDDIVVGKTGYCYILGETGTDIADPDPKVVRSMWKTTEQAKTDSKLKSLADFENMVLIRFVFVKRKSINLWISIANIVTLVYCMLLRLLVYHLDKQQHTISNNMYKERGLMGLHVGFRIKKKGF